MDNYYDNPFKVRPASRYSGRLPPKQGRPPVKCNIRPECKSCNIPTHGFICHFSDGSCLRCKNVNIAEETE